MQHVPWQTAKLLESMSENGNSLASTPHFRTGHSRQLILKHHLSNTRGRGCPELTLQIHYEIKHHPKSTSSIRQNHLSLS